MTLYRIDETRQYRLDTDDHDDLYFEGVLVCVAGTEETEETCRRCRDSVGVPKIHEYDGFVSQRRFVTDWEFVTDPLVDAAVGEDTP